MSKKIIRPATTSARVGIGDRQLRNLEAAGQFPKRFAISPNGRAMGHLEDEVDDYIEKRAASRAAE